jgi:DNA-binding SARP family transcriptional activator/tetratricopeptide (TPR) repeat protein
MTAATPHSESSAGAGAGLNFRVLGPVEIAAGDQIVNAGHARQRAVLAVLLLDAGRVVPAERLIDRVWGEDPPASVRKTLYGYAARLRAVIAGAGEDGVGLFRRQGGYVLQAGPGQLDLLRFRRLAASAAAEDDEQAAALLGEALALWRGPALAGLDSPWLAAMRDTLELERHAAALDLSDVRLRLGQHAALVSELAAQAAAAPADERLIGQLMLAMYRSGRQADALRWFEQTRHYLAEELGADPGPELRELHQQILRADPALAVGAPAGVAPAAAPAAAGRPAGPVPRELPADVAGFTGRAAELAALDGLLLSTPKTTAAVISAVSGTAGVGKTALAVRWAHHAAAHFPDGQLHVNLRGYDPAQPVSAADALAGFLRSLGVPGPDIPREETERAARYRSLLAGRRMLIVLDNAGTVGQVRPLLPGHPACAVLVTSRDSLAGLVARDGARRLDLDLLPLADAVALLHELIGDQALGSLDAVTELAGLCARLPLALRIAAELAAARPGAPLAELVAELRTEQVRLDVLHADGDPHTAVRSVFSWSYDHLDDQAARMFRLLGLHPGPDISVPAAASLAGVLKPQARRLLGGLARAHLIAEHVPGRYAFHDLLRAYAAGQAHAHESQDEREAAVGRVLDHYLHTAASAGLLLNPAREPVVLVPPRPGAAPEQLAGYAQAMAWFEAEHQVLLASITLADSSGFGGHAWQLPWAMASFLQIRGHWQEWAATARTALAAATRLGDTAAQAMSGRLLAMACSELGDHDQARSLYADSLTLYQRLGNRHGQARIQHNLGVLAGNQGRYADALGHCEQALRLYHAIGDKAAEAEALNNVGWCHGQLGDYQQARACCQQAVNLCAETGDRLAEGAAWTSLGYAEHHLGNLAEAAACHQRAVSIARESGFRLLEATALSHLGDTCHAADDLAAARHAWQPALTIYEHLRHPDADQVRAKLAGTAGHASHDPSA